MKSIRYLAVGFSISVLLFALFGTALLLFFPTSLPAAQELNLIATLPASMPAALTQTVVPTNPPTLTLTSTFVPTNSPTAIITLTLPPQPTSTLTPLELMVAAGELAFQGPLTRAQQEELYETSLRYVAKTPADGLRISTELNGVKVYPNTTCGPLAIAILREAGLIAAEIVPHDYWLLNPDVPENRNLLENVFPESLYDNTRFKIRLNKVDWQAQPLVPGDFVYIYSGNGGNFEHMLVVTRVDWVGRVYSVTNFYTPNGFIIDETLLYDPSDSSAGIFRQWTSRQWAASGSTGFDGFELWRLKGSQ